LLHPRSHAALQKGNTLPGHIAGLVRAMKPGIESTLKQPGADLEQRAVIANVRYNVERLKTAKPILAAMVAKNCQRRRDSRPAWRSKSRPVA